MQGILTLAIAKRDPCLRHSGKPRLPANGEFGAVPKSELAFSGAHRASLLGLESANPIIDRPVQTIGKLARPKSKERHSDILELYA